MISGLVQPKFAPSSMAKIRQVKLAAKRSQPGISKWSEVVSWLWRMAIMPSTNATRSNGNRAAKIARQLNVSESQPPTEGPTAGATAVTSEPTPIIKPRFFCGACSVMMLNMSGSATPVPIPSSTRPISSAGKTCAVMPHTMPAM